jgi:hypothetical protein
MSTEFQQTEAGPREKIAPTADWTSLNKSVQPQTFIASAYFNGVIYLFAQNQQKALSVGVVDFSGTSAAWSDYSYACTSSPAVAVASMDQSCLGVACLQSATIVDIHYYRPSSGMAGQVSVTSGLSRGTVLSGALQLARNFDGRIEVFASDTFGNIWHAWETNHAVPATWSQWFKLGTAYNQAKEFMAVQIPSGANAGCIQVVSLGSDGLMYQATEVIGNVGQYHPFAAVGKYDHLRNSARFDWGPAATFDSSNGYMVYGAFNLSPVDGKSPLDYCLGGDGEWTAIAGSTSNAPVAQPPVVLATTANKVTHLVWGDSDGQFYMLNRARNYWADMPQTVGKANLSLTGYVTAVANDNKVGLVQSLLNGAVMFINVLPT